MTTSAPILATTLKLLQENYACKPSYKKLRKTLPARWPMDRPIDLLTILDSNGLLDTIWCFRATITPADTIARLYACDCAEHLQQQYGPLMPRSMWRPARAILAARRYALGMESAARAATDGVAVYTAYDDAVNAAAASDATEVAWQTKCLRDWLTGQRTPETVRAELKEVVP